MSKRLISYLNFSRGRNGTASADVLLPNELRDISNFILMSRGGYDQRKGCTKAIPASLGTSPVVSMLNYPGQKLAVVGTTLMDWQGNVILAGLSSGNIAWEYFTNSKLYFCDGVKYYVYDGTTASEVTPASGADLTNVKKCKVLIQRGQRMFAMGDGSNSVYFSAVGEPNNFTTSQEVRAISEDRYTPVAAAVFGDALIVYKRNTVYAYTGWDPSTETKFNPVRVHDGTQSPQSICAANDYLMFLGDDAVIAMSVADEDRIGTSRVSPGITDIIEKLTNRDKAVAIFHKGKYYLACCDDGTGVNNLVLVGYVTMPFQDNEGIVFPWTVIKGWKVASWFKDDDDALYFGSATGGMIYKAFDSNTDDGVAIVSTATHRFNLDDAFRVKKLKSLLILARQYESLASKVQVSVSLGYYKELKEVQINESGYWDISDWDEVLFDYDDLVKKEIDMGGRKCDRVELILTHDVLNEPLTIYGYGATYKPKKPKGVKMGVTDI